MYRGPIGPVSAQCGAHYKFHVAVLGPIWLGVFGGEYPMGALYVPLQSPVFVLPESGCCRCAGLLPRVCRVLCSA